jgi:hypothetical protein
MDVNAGPTTNGPPPEVNEACGLILASLVLGLLGGLADALYAVEPRPPQPDPSALAAAWDLAVFFGTLLLTPWLVWCIRRRRLWARWAMLVLLCYGWLLVAQDIPTEWPRSTWLALTEGATTLMEFAAVGLLFFGRGGRWLARDDA